MNAPASGTPQRAVAENRSCWGVILTGLDIKRDRGRDRGHNRGLDHQAFNKKIGDSCTTITHGMTGEKNYIITLAPSRNRSHLHRADHVLKRIPFLSFDDGLASDNVRFYCSPGNCHGNKRLIARAAPFVSRTKSKEQIARKGVMFLRIRGIHQLRVRGS